MQTTRIQYLQLIFLMSFDCLVDIKHEITRTKLLYTSHAGATALDGSRVVDGTGPIFLDELRCTGRESSLFNCSHNRLGAHDCDHSDDAGVNCIGMVENINFS